MMFHMHFEFCRWIQSIESGEVDWSGVYFSVKRVNSVSSSIRQKIFGEAGREANKY